MQPYLVSVSRLHEALAFERALEQLVTARRLSSGVEDDVALSLWEGIIMAEMNWKDEAAGAFKAALFLQPDAQLPVRVSPRISEQFDSLRKDVKHSLARRGEATAQVADTPHEEPAQPSATEVPPAARTERTPRSRALLPAIIGGTLAAAGGVSWALSRGELSKLQNTDPTLADLESVDRSVSRGRTLQTTGVGLMSAGVLGLGLAAGMYLLGAPTERGSVSLGTDGRSAFVSGSLP
ncbi:hypothetical protein D7V93_34260 [Corallococcus llansteffanensis]|uniref:Uncharacterized protein n=1 Tax=Corallococcus llansteffanensis TaxID=2316731 RepID=A0A3A8NS74_9BACT|nr:hypothetical protein D7V93_34260 [Corallococcus llansteffanensis]